MHIIVLELEPTSFRGGQELSLFDVCYGLAQRGHTISLLYTKVGNLLERYQEFCRDVVKVNRFTIYPPQYNFHLLADIWQLQRKIPTTKNSIVLSNQYQDAYFASALALSKNIPHICYLHLPPPDQILELKGVKQFIRDSYIRWQWNIGLKGVNQFIAVSHQTKWDWVNCGLHEQKIHVVHNGINLEVYKPPTDFCLIRKQWNIPQDIRVISYVGRLDKEKGLETLIKAFALLNKNVAKTKLLIAGKSLHQGIDYQKSLEQLSTQLGIENHIEFLGHITNTANLYQVSDVTVLPSLWSEPFGRVVIESMACGTPVVGSRIGGITEILTGKFQNGLFEPGNERNLSDTLNQIINWRNNLPELGKQCRQHILSQFNVEKMINGVEQVLDYRYAR
ncbi:glycosyltransferase [Cylindrospermum stagnale PCC 7417]|uniref:Glycosyltransferase n=1 Tax=Cylindrospermum stagnale PCC 7417 TaxID=56107 RepID=K9WSK7_9NOST|nr:glycosyltransferase family 4 protein [Cylindrospermum stagnale]AFZ22784.1 glycosyltransferase [Cylindrospermum stagnale PCC 7417]